MSPLGTTLWSLDLISSSATADHLAHGFKNPEWWCHAAGNANKWTGVCVCEGSVCAAVLFIALNGCRGSANRLPAVTLLIFHWTGCRFRAPVGGCVWTYRMFITVATVHRDRIELSCIKYSQAFCIDHCWIALHWWGKIKLVTWQFYQLAVGRCQVVITVIPQRHTI